MCGERIVRRLLMPSHSVPQQENGARQPSLTLATTPPSNIMVYEYGCRLDRESLPAVYAQFHLAHRLYNDLIAILRRVRDEAEALVRERAPPDAQELIAREAQWTAEFERAKSANEEQQRIAAATERRKVRGALRPLLAATRKALREEIKAIYAQVGKRRECLTFIARCEAVRAGLGWATADAVLDRALQSHDRAIKDGGHPQFRAATAVTQEHLVARTTVPGGLPAEVFLEGRNQNLILSPPKRIGDRQYGEFSFRLGQATDGVYATGTWQYHRPFPEGARIGLARLVRKRIGKDTRWSLQFQVALPEPLSAPVADRRDALASVHFGWSLDVSGRRVAGIGDSSDPDTARLLQLPPDIERDLLESAAILSRRDTMRDDIHAAIKAQPMPELPDIPLFADRPDYTITDELRTVRALPAQNVAPRRLYRLASALRRHVPDALPELAAWAATDRKLLQSQSHVRERALKRRRAFYRGVARDIAERYKAVVIEPLDLKDAARIIDEDTGERTEFIAQARAGRVVACVSEFTQLIRSECVKRETPVIELKYATTVAVCAHCGGHNEPRDVDMQVLDCQHCGAVTDRKLNGAARAWQFANGDPALFADYAQLLAQRQEALREKKREKLERQAKARMARKAEENPDGIIRETRESTSERSIGKSEIPAGSMRSDAPGSLPTSTGW